MYAKPRFFLGTAGVGRLGPQGAGRISRRYDVQAPIAFPNRRNYSPRAESRGGTAAWSRRVETGETAANRQSSGIAGPTRNQSLGPCREHSLVLTWGQSLSPLLTSFLIPNPSLPLPYPSWRLFGGGFVGFIRFFGVGGRNRWGQKAPGAENAYTTHPTIKIGLKAQF